jgi:short-subunit dehydrogenase
MRLKIENKTRKKQIDVTVVAPAPAQTNNDSAKMVDEATVKALENEIEQLQA